MMRIAANSMWDVAIHVAIILLIIAVFFLSFFFLYLPATTNHGEALTVPDTRKMSVVQLQETMKKHELTYQISDSTFVPHVPPHMVLSQYPQPGAKVKRGRKIYVTVTRLTAPMMKMPNLTDMTLPSAKMRMQGLGLELGEITYKPDLANNSVLEQWVNGKKIKADAPIAKGTKVDLVVGNGLGKTEFDTPNLVGTPIEDAQFILSGAGLNIGRQQVVDNPNELPGTVIQQYPRSGAKIRVGSTVDIWMTRPTDSTTISNQ